MSEAQSGDRVKVHYTGKLGDGKVFDSSVEREPLEVNLGEGQVIPGFENAIVGMNTGESKTVEIPVAQAYGPRNEELVVEVTRDGIPPDVNPNVGEILHVQQPDGQQHRVTVAATSDTTLTLDGNHPLAGQDLTFEIELVEIG